MKKVELLHYCQMGQKSRFPTWSLWTLRCGKGANHCRSEVGGDPPWLGGTAMPHSCLPRGLHRPHGEYWVGVTFLLLLGVESRLLPVGPPLTTWRSGGSCLFTAVGGRITMASHGASIDHMESIRWGSHLITAVGVGIKIASRGASIDCMDYVGWELPYYCCWR